MAKAARSGGFSCGPIAARRGDKDGKGAMEDVRAAQADVSKVDAVDVNHPRVAVTKVAVNHPRVGEVVSKAGGVASSPQARWWTLCQ